MRAGGREWKRLSAQSVCGRTESGHLTFELAIGALPPLRRPSSLSALRASRRTGRAGWQGMVRKEPELDYFVSRSPSPSCRDARSWPPTGSRGGLSALLSCLCANG